MSTRKQLPGQNRAIDERDIFQTGSTSMKSQLPRQDARRDSAEYIFVTPAESDADIAAHAAEANPHPVYLTQAEGDTRYPQKSATTVANPAGGGTVDTEARTQLNALLAALRATGVIGT